MDAATVMIQPPPTIEICSGCGRQVVWCYASDGSGVLVDALSVDDGELAVLSSTGERPIVARVRVFSVDEPRFDLHFCR